MDFITIVFLAYTFIALYFFFLFILIYFQNKSEFFHYPKAKRNYSLSIIVPCYNEERDIGGTIEALLNMGYKGLRKIIVVDDCSTDNSYEIIKKYEEKYSKVMGVQTPKNTGNAAGAKNYGVKFAKTELIGFTDADSYPNKGSASKMVGFFNDLKVGVVTSTVLVKNRNKFIEKLQSIEYKVIKFSRKLLEFIDAIYVTPGPLAIYRKTAFDEVGGFDEDNLTEDIEITWNLQAHDWRVRMCVPSRVYTVAPSKIKEWIKQRNRWNMGGLQTIIKYRKAIFKKKGMLGAFILPFFILSWFLGLFGITILGYRLVREIVVNYLSAKYSIGAQTAILTLREINLTPHVLIFLGLVLFLFGLFFTLIALSNVREKQYKRIGVFTLGFYLIFYLLAYPIILIISLTKFLKRKRAW